MGNTLQDAPEGLPYRLSTFVGRQREVLEIRRLLSTHHMVTLTGPGGVGKTRLALEAADAVRHGFPDGVALAELEHVRDPALVANAVAVAVGLREQSARTPLAMLVDYLASRRVLLVLDNSEHLVSAVAEVAAALIAGCPDLRILATSRQWLGLHGEQSLQVPPLSVPEPDRRYDVSELLEHEAVALFVDRAAAAVPTFALDEDNAAEVAEICRRLDGLPLAIELAAARTRALSVHDIVTRLSDHPHLLEAEASTTPSRQQTLRSCIEWSFSLCSPREQLLWARLSVFTGGLELDAAEEVAASHDLPAGEVLYTLASLVDKSIMASEWHGDVIRYRMLETVREFGLEQLELVGEQTRLRRRHRDWCLALVERADRDWVSSSQADWFARLDREHANVQGAMHFSLTEEGETEAALRMLVALFHFYWWGRGWAREGRLWLGRALDQPAEPSAVRAKALLTDASLALADGDFDAGRQRLADAEAIAETIDEPSVVAMARWIAGSIALYSGEVVTALALFEEGLAVLEPDRDLTVRLDLLLSYTSGAGMLGDSERATSGHREFLRITEPAGEYFHRSYALWSFGLFSMQQGDLEGALDLIRQSISLRKGIRDLTGLGWSMESQAWVEAALGRFDRAATMLGAADKLWEIMGRPLRTYQHMYPAHEACEQGAREQLGAERFEHEYEQGRSMGLDQAISYALGEQPTPEPTTEEAVAEPDPMLTRREREIAELIAEGLSNRQIADRLTISVRTAETHAQNILTKLGFRTRSAVAAWVARHRDSPTPGPD